MTKLASFDGNNPNSANDDCTTSLNNLAFLKVEGKSQLNKKIEETMNAMEGNKCMMISKEALINLDIGEDMRVDSLDNAYKN